MTRYEGATPEGGELMGTREVAEYLRLKERKIYELVKARRIPCTRVTGKWLFPKVLIDRWLTQNAEFSGEWGRPLSAPPAVIAGSHDPLAEWAVRQSACGLAVLGGGSVDGLRQMSRNKAMLVGMHLYDPAEEDYNVPLVRRELAGLDVVVLEWAQRDLGLVMAPENPLQIKMLGDIKTTRARVAIRQADAGSQIRFEQLLAAAGIGISDLSVSAGPARSETDIGVAVQEGKADCGPAVAAVARQFRLGFLPLVRERFDLVLRRRDYFEPPVQALLAFARTSAFAERARDMGGYDVSGLGTVRYNGP